MSDHHQKPTKSSNHGGARIGAGRKIQEVPQWFVEYLRDKQNPGTGFVFVCPKDRAERRWMAKLGLRRVRVDVWGLDSCPKTRQDIYKSYRPTSPVAPIGQTRTDKESRTLFGQQSSLLALQPPALDYRPPRRRRKPWTVEQLWREAKWSALRDVVAYVAPYVVAARPDKDEDLIARNLADAIGDAYARGRSAEAMLDALAVALESEDDLRIRRVLLAREYPDAELGTWRQWCAQQGDDVEVLDVDTGDPVDPADLPEMLNDMLEEALRRG